MGKIKLKTSRILGIDWGKSRVGLAMADSETKIAFTYGTVENDKNLLQKIAEIINRENINTIVIGIPSYINKKKIKSAGEKLGNALRNLFFALDVEYQDEMFTTKMAQKNLIEKGVRGIKRYDDQEAAKIILQEWLDKIAIRNR